MCPEVKEKKSIFILILFICVSFSQVAGQPMAEGGVLDLRNYDFRSQGTLKVEGEWHFYWRELIDPVGQPDAPGTLVHVPSSWQKLEEVVPGISSKGYASYYLEILVPPEMENIALRFTEVFSGSGYYVNGRNIGFNGLPGTNKYQAVFGYSPTMHVVPVRDSVLDLVVHVSNFEHRAGGIRGTVELGTPMQIMSESAERQYRDFFLLGAFLVIGIYFMGLYLMRARLYILFFSLIGLVMSFRILILSDTTLYAGDWLSGISRLRMEYLSFDILVPLFVLMVRFLFPNDFPRLLFRMILWICGLMIVLVIITPVSLFSQVFPYYMVFVIFTSAAVFYVMGLAWSRGRIYAPAFTIGMAVAATGAIIDMLNIADVTESGLVSHFTMFVFLVIYTLVFSGKSNEELRQNQLVAEEILDRNQGLAARMQEKERQLREKSEALGWCVEDLRKSKEELGMAIDLRNKFLTVLGHDIKAPVGYAKQVIDMMIAGEIDAKEQPKMLRLLSGSSNATLNLLENLIYWGRSQSGELRSMAVEFPVGRILAESAELFDLPLKEKNISLVTELPDDTMVFADKEQVKLILRNLVSNAIKFTMTGGRIVLRGESDLSDNVTRIEIEDSGVGISPAELKELLSSHEIHSTEGTRKEKGTGIGLKLCRELAGLNNGFLEVESEPGQGSLFRVILPLRAPH